MKQLVIPLLLVLSMKVFAMDKYCNGAVTLPHTNGGGLEQLLLLYLLQLLLVQKHPYVNTRLYWELQKLRMRQECMDQQKSAMEV